MVSQFGVMVSLSGEKSSQLSEVVGQSQSSVQANPTDATSKGKKDFLNNNNNNKPKLGCHPVAEVILHVNKT